MDRESLIGLTKNLYRLTLLFPHKEPLRYKAREVADEVLANFLRVSQGGYLVKIEEGAKGFFAKTMEDLEILDSFFEVAIAQNWVSPFDVLEIQKEYSTMKKALESFIDEGQAVAATEKPETTLEEMEALAAQNSLFFGQGRMNERQKRILEILKEKKKAQVWELKKVFPEITKRTLRRDFEQMLKQGLIERIGERNNTFYQLKNKTDIG